MTKINLLSYYNLGNLMSELRTWITIFLKSPQANDYRKARYVIDRLNSILLIIETEDITESVKELATALSAWQKKYVDTTKVFTIEDTKLLSTLLSRLDAVARNELQYFTAYSFDHDSNLNIVKLEEEGAKGMYTANIWNQLPEIAKRDVEESAKCLLYSLPTASGILALRGMEEVVRRYLEIIDTNEISKGSTPKTWGEILGFLESLKVDNAILGQLKYLKNGIRNPLSHPEMILTMDEAESIFFVVKNSVNMILKELERQRKEWASGKVE